MHCSSLREDISEDGSRAITVVENMSQFWSILVITVCHTSHFTESHLEQCLIATAWVLLFVKAEF